MLVVVLAWVYVIAMVSLTLSSALAGLLTFALIGCAPVGLWFWLTLLKLRARRERQALVSGGAKAAEDSKSTKLPNQ